MSTAQTVYVSSEGRWSDIIKGAKKEATNRTAHGQWELESIDEYHREVGVYNNHGRKVGTELESKVVLHKA